MDAFNFDLEALKKEQEKADTQKQMLGLVGGVADSLANTPTAWEIMKGRDGRRIDIAGQAKAMQDQVADPWARRKQLFDQYQMAKNAQKMDRDQALEDALSKTDSTETQALYKSFANSGVKLPAGLTGRQISEAYGKPAEFALAKFKEEQNRKTELAKAGAKVPRGYIKRINPETGQEELVPDDGAIKNTQFPPALFGKRMQQSEDNFSSLNAKGFDPTAMTNQIQRLSIVPELLKSEDVKSQEQAERNFVNAVLRRESGSAISNSEFESAAKQYFPQPGDTPAILKQKKQNRELAIAGLQAEAGQAWNKFGAQGAAPRGVTYSEMLKSKGATQGGDPFTPSAYAAPGGPRPGSIEDGHRFKGGDPSDPASWERVK